MALKALPDWIAGYDRRWLTADVIAGLTVAAILVPEGMAYAQVAGVAAEVAFYTIPPALVLYALFGSSRQLVVATSGAIAVLSASIVGSIVDGVIGGVCPVLSFVGHVQGRDRGAVRRAQAGADRPVLLRVSVDRFRVRSRPRHLDQTGAQTPGHRVIRRQLLRATLDIVRHLGDADLGASSSA